MISEFVDFCITHNIPYEQGRNWCDCVDYTDFINFWVNGKVHTLYVLDSGGYKLDNVVIADINEIKERLGL